MKMEDEELIDGIMRGNDICAFDEHGRELEMMEEDCSEMENTGLVNSIVFEQSYQEFYVPAWETSKSQMDFQLNANYTEGGNSMEECQTYQSGEEKSVYLTLTDVSHVSPMECSPASIPSLASTPHTALSIHHSNSLSQPELPNVVAELPDQQSLICCAKYRTTSKSKKLQKKKSVASSSVEKPKESYKEIIAKAILSNKEKKMCLDQIYTYMMRKYKFFTKENNLSWKNSIRYNLTQFKCFEKCGKSGQGKGHCWSIADKFMKPFENGDFKVDGAKERRKSVKRKEQTSEMTVNNVQPTEQSKADFAMNTRMPLNTMQRPVSAPPGVYTTVHSMAQSYLLPSIPNSSAAHNQHFIDEGNITSQVGFNVPPHDSSQSLTSTAVSTSNSFQLNPNISHLRGPPARNLECNMPVYTMQRPVTAPPRMYNTADSMAQSFSLPFIGSGFPNEGNLTSQVGSSVPPHDSWRSLTNTAVPTSNSFQLNPNISHLRGPPAWNPACRMPVYTTQRPISAPSSVQNSADCVTQLHLLYSVENRSSAGNQQFFNRSNITSQVGSNVMPTHDTSLRFTSTVASTNNLFQR